MENGFDVAFVSVNAISADQPLYQSKLIFNDWDSDEPNDHRCTFPLFQDTDDVGAWDLHNGGKDDIYVYDANGNLSSFIPSSGPNTNLSTDEGYESLTLAILKASGMLN